LTFPDGYTTVVPMRRTRHLLAILMAAAFLIPSCSGKLSKQTGLTDSNLFSRGQQKLAKKSYSSAIEHFQVLLERFPTSPLAPKTQLAGGRPHGKRGQRGGGSRLRRFPASVPGQRQRPLRSLPERGTALPPEEQTRPGPDENPRGHPHLQASPGKEPLRTLRGNGRQTAGGSSQPARGARSQGGLPLPLPPKVRQRGGQGEKSSGRLFRHGHPLVPDVSSGGGAGTGGEEGGGRRAQKKPPGEIPREGRQER